MKATFLQRFLAYIIDVMLLSMILSIISSTSINSSNYNKLLEEQNVNKATKVMMDMQKPLKKFYEKKSSNYTKEMVQQLIHIAKNNLDYNDCEFLKEYLK